MTRDHSAGHLPTNDITVTSLDNNNNSIGARHTWDITDNVGQFPVIEIHDDFVEYPMGYVKYAYSGDSTEARTHQSGWAARNANNHNQAILKKSCLGVLLCDRQCQTDNGQDIVRVRPSICDKARRKQINKPCPTPNCAGRLRLRPCRGHGGYPVTHFWREVVHSGCGTATTSTIFFQAKGEHDHPPPLRKSVPAASRLKPKLKENRKPKVASKSRRRNLTRGPTLPDVKTTSTDPCRDVIDKQPFSPPIVDGLPLVQPQYLAPTPDCHVISYTNNNNSSHVTSLTNHSSPYDRLQLLTGERCNTVAQTFPTNYVIDQVLSNAWIGPNTVSDSIQPTTCLPTARQLPVTFDEVITGRQRAAEYYSGSVDIPSDHISWSQGTRHLCPSWKNSTSGLSASLGAHYMTTSNASSLTVCPAPSNTWLDGQQIAGYRACTEYRMSRHVVADVTSGDQCGWTGVCDFDELMWQEKFIKPRDASQTPAATTITPENFGHRHEGQILTHLTADSFLSNTSSFYVC